MHPLMSPEPISNYTSVWGEGPIWHNDRLLYVDIEDHKIISFTPSTGAEKIWDVGQRVGTVVPRASGGLIWAGEKGIFSLDETSGESTLIIHPEAAIATNRFNDGKCDPAGRFWAGTMDMNSPRQPVSALWCLNTDHRIEKKFAPVTISNGLVWTQDTQTFYYIDTPRKCVLAFDFDNATGNISNQRTLWDTSADPSSPDGMTIDSEDRLWVAFCHGAKVVCFDPATKKIEAQIDFPCVETTACAFGGPDLGDLYITTGIKSGLEEPLAGRLFVCRPGAKGVPATAFGA